MVAALQPARRERARVALRRALARAGIVLGYTHVCRKKGCGHAEEPPDGALRHCPEHGHKL